MDICKDCISRLRLKMYDIHIDYRDCPHTTCTLKNNLVLCKDCRHYHAYINAKIGLGLCTYFMQETQNYGFCSNAERKEDNGKID